MKIQHKAYRQNRSVFVIALILNTDYGSITPKKLNICSHWVESVWKYNIQHIATLSQFL